MSPCEEDDESNLTLLCCLAHASFSMMFSKYLQCSKHV